MTETVQNGDVHGPAKAPEDVTRLTLLTHDIRSAVFDVIGGLRQVDTDTLDPETRLQLERVRISGETLARLVEDALNIVAGGLGEAAPGFSNLHLHRLLKDAELRWTGRAHATGVNFSLSIAEDLPAVISTNRLGLERILSNLLSNALKYAEGGSDTDTNTGHVSLDASLTPDGALCFAISDTGPGFSDEALSHLYEMNARPKGLAKPGSGMGLHIAKDIADRAGATINVENSSTGASVTLCMPSHIWNHAPTAIATTSLPDLSNIRVLVAEDSETNQLIIGQMLRLMGAEFETAADGVEALNWLERERFDFAMLDIDMPRLSGIEVMRHIRAQTTELRDLPILAVTAFTLRANRDAIYDAGANRILAKPINGPEALGYSICALLDIATRQDTTGRILARMGDTLNEERFAHLLSIAGPDSTGELLSRLCTDLKYVQMLLSTALQLRNLPDTRGQTHVLISLAGAVGAERLQRQSEALNAAAHRDDDVAFDVLGDGVLSQLEELIARVVLEYDAFLKGAAHG